MCSFRLLADEHVKRAFVTALRANGYEVYTVDEDYPGGLDDDRLLDRCRDDSRVVLTNDDDFVRIARSREHAGVILYSDQDHPPREIVRGIVRIEHYLDRDELWDHVEWLENWL